MAQPQHGAGKVIIGGAAMAVLLLWYDGASHSIPLMLAISVGALVVFVALRNAGKAQMTPEERLERERQDALEWLAKSDAKNPDQPDEILD